MIHEHFEHHGGRLLRSHRIQFDNHHRDNANLTINNLNITNASTAIITIDGGLTINGTGSFKGTSISGAGNGSKIGNITITGTAHVVSNSLQGYAAAIGSTFGEQIISIGDIKIIEDATVPASSAHSLAIDNVLYVEGETFASSY